MVQTPLINVDDNTEIYSNGVDKSKSTSTEGQFPIKGTAVYNADSLTLYNSWDSPTAIIADGPYGVSSVFGDLHYAEDLYQWYEPHVQLWSSKSTPQTTLWFWNTEIGWATIHPLLVKYGWKYVRCNIWDKGIAHVAGNTNTKKLRQFPVVTEVCVQYIRDVRLPSKGHELPLKDWLRNEWQRSGLPLHKSNEACGVKNAATRKYLTKDHLWYFPPPEAFVGLSKYANTYGKLSGRPYFSVDDKNPLTAEEWSKMRPKFFCPVGITNVWHEPAIHGSERLKLGSKSVHLNQKPLKLIELLISASTDSGDLVWEPFGGLCSVAVASLKLGRRSVSAERDRYVYEVARMRIATNGAKS